MFRDKKQKARQEGLGMPAGGLNFECGGQGEGQSDHEISAMT